MPDFVEHAKTLLERCPVDVPAYPDPSPAIRHLEYSRRAEQLTNGDRSAIHGWLCDVGGWFHGLISSGFRGEIEQRVNVVIDLVKTRRRWRSMFPTNGGARSDGTLVRPYMDSLPSLGDQNEPERRDRVNLARRDPLVTALPNGKLRDKALQKQRPRWTLLAYLYVLTHEHAAHPTILHIMDSPTVHLKTTLLRRSLEQSATELIRYVAYVCEALHRAVADMTKDAPPCRKPRNQCRRRRQT